MRGICVSWVVAVCASWGSPALAVVYDLAADFSDANNPNGAWAFRKGTAILSHVSANSGNPLDAAVGNGFWGTDPQYAPSVIKVTANGSAASGYDNDDFLAGDVISHSTNPGNGDPVFITWTAPAAGTVEYDGRAWYAHSPVVRSNDFFLRLNGGAPLETGVITPLTDRPNALVFDSNAPFAVAAGDVLALQLSPTAGQSFGSISGVALTIDFVPEPTGLCLLAFGAASLSVRRWRRR